MPMSQQDIIEALRQKKLHLDCFQMVLTQNRSIDPITYRGTGYISQSEEDVLQFKLYASETKNTDVAKDLNHLGAVRSGEVFAEEEYFTLAALDKHGTEWTADRMLPTGDWNLALPNPIVHGRIWVLESRKPASLPRNSLQLHFFDAPELSYNLMVKTESDGRALLTRSMAKVAAARIEFTFRAQTYGFAVDALGSSTLHESLPSRIQEAIRYVSAQTVSYRVLLANDVGNQHMEIHSAVRRAPATALLPPLTSNPAHSVDYWRLFACYLEYILKHTSHPYWNRCSYYLHNACEASAGSYDLCAVGARSCR